MPIPVIRGAERLKKTVKKPAAHRIPGRNLLRQAFLLI